MAVTVDASSPAVVTGNSVTSVTTAAFNPPADSLLLAVHAWASSGTAATSVAMSNSAPALDHTAWTLAARMDQNLGTNDGAALIYWGRITSARTGMTVTGAPSVGKPFDNYGLMRVLVITGFNTSNPVGTTGTGESDTNDITPTVYTSTANNSRGFGVGSDANFLGAPTTSDTSGGTVHINFAISGISAYKAAVTPTSGTGVTINFNAGGTAAAQWNWAAIEIRGDDEGGGGATIGGPVLRGRAISPGRIFGGSTFIAKKGSRILTPAYA